MASNEDENLEDAGQDRNLKERIALSNAYAVLRGQETIQSFSAFTFEEAVDSQIERIEGGGGGTAKRPNLLARVDKIEQEALQAIRVLKKIPPEQFIEHDEEEDVNTEE
jgi:hypothetical protein